jgi:hypothetical protein
LEGFFYGGYIEGKYVTPGTEIRDLPEGIKLKRQTF